MLYIIAITIIIIIICAIVIVIKKMHNRIKINSDVIDNLENQNGKLNLENEKLKNDLEKSSISIKNLKNALLYKPLIDAKRYIEIHTLKEGQEIVVMFDEEYLYALEYFKQEPLCEKEPYIETKKLTSRCFIDGEEIYNPVLMCPINKEDNSAEIDDIDTNKYKGRGLGTYIIKTLHNVLKSYDVKDIKAKLSPVDYPVKSKLYKFYRDYNDFEIVRELEEDTWGLAVKKISK